MRAAPHPWEEAYRRQGRLWRGVRLDEGSARLLEDHPRLMGERWLDAGCGDGKGLVPLLDQAGGQVVGADHAVWGLRLVRSADAAAGRRVVRADAAAWPFPDGCFAAVRAVHLVGHFVKGSRGVVVEELARVMRRGGFLLLVEFGTGDFRCGHGDEVEPASYRRGVGIVTHYFEAGEVEGLAREAGLEVVSSEAERFEVSYGGVLRRRERFRVVARRPDGAA